MGVLREIAPGVRVATSDYAMTTTTVVAGSDGRCLVIDPALTAGDLDGLARDLRDLGLTPSAGFSTHPHWDHVLWCAALGEVARYAPERAVAVTLTERQGMVDGVQRAAPGHDLGLFGDLTPLPAGTCVIPWSGPEARIVEHDGHAPGHAAVFLAGSGVLVCGDMLSDTEIPLLDLLGSDPLGEYLIGLDRLAGVEARLVVPGHGHVGDARELRRRLDADRAYLADLRSGHAATDPRLSAPPDWMREQHESQTAYLNGGPRFA